MRWDRPTEVRGRLARAAEWLALTVRTWVSAAGSRIDGHARGQGIVEYGLILSLSALLTVVLLVFFGGTLSAVLQAVGDAIDSAT